MKLGKPGTGPSRSPWARIGLVATGLSAVLVLAGLVWTALAFAGNPDPTAPAAARQMSGGAVVIGAGILVFREGLETILVLAAITASMVGANATQRRPVAAGSLAGFAVTIATWFVVVAILNAVNAPEFQIQAATGLVAVVVLLVVMNWFFHKLYWTGWIQTHNRAKRRLSLPGSAHQRLLLGLGLVGFASVYREGFEVVLFLQTLRLQSSAWMVLLGVLVGLYLTVTVGVLTFVIHHRLPYKRMLTLTGVMLGAVLLVMVGEEINELQLAGWMTTTALPFGIRFPDWMGTWFSLFANWETLIAMTLSAGFVIGSYYLANYIKVWRPRARGGQPAIRPESAPAHQS
ncbi:MAG: FTR1 family protein [Candidatus Dormibacteraeota bacterium]|nr:FTR1 family protein [Candidatus Dormibacteraeota bacterium]MBO0709230.1 FTR1 family protein [Candidatus Dormibacteraeota bacterium]